MQNKVQGVLVVSEEGWRFIMFIGERIGTMFFQEENWVQGVEIGLGELRTLPERLGDVKRFILALYVLVTPTL